MAINKDKVQRIASQALNEIQFARTFKQGKILNWQKNEEMYYQKKRKIPESRSSVQLGRMQEFVHTLLSKIDNPLVFKFTKRKNAQLKRVDLLNALRQIDQNNDNWDIKDLVGKKQAIIYGRAHYSYYADSINGIYRPHLDPIDAYDMLVDPECGGIEIEEASHLGSYNVSLNKKMLKDGAKEGYLLKWGVSALIDEGSGNAGDATQEQTNKRPRMYDQNTIGQKYNGDPTKFKFWRWCSTFQEDGERYYLLMDNGGRVVRCEYLEDMFTPDSDIGTSRWPFWTWAAFPDLTEYWTPSYCDYAREIFMAQDVTVNQALDNTEAINKPMRLVNTGMIENMAELKYRREGIIKVKGDVDINKAYQTVITPSVNTPLEVFKILEDIQQKASGVTDATAGVADEDGRVAIYEGNQVATADRFGLLNKSYAFGYKRFARLYELGVSDNLVKKVAVDIIGPNGIEVKDVRRGDIFHRGDRMGVLVEASNAQMLNSAREQDAKQKFLEAHALDSMQNQKKAYEMEAKISGFTEDEVDQLLDTSFYGNSELMSECDRDIERLLDGEKFLPNELANNAYKQHMVNYLRDHNEDITTVQFNRMAAYITSLEPLIYRNEARALQNEQTQSLLNKPATAPAIGGAPAAQATLPNPQLAEVSTI